MPPTRPLTVVITGASSGIGLATALAFARAQARVVLRARGEAPLARAAAACRELGARALAVPGDVTQPAAMHRLAERAAEFGDGGIDVWVNNAGVGAVGLFDETPVAAHEQVVRINLLGYLHGAHAVLPFFKAARKGVLVNIVSLGAWAPSPYGVSYTASKFGLRGFSEALRAELVDYPQIRICDIFPATADTPGMRHSANYTGKALRSAAAAGRGGRGRSCRAARGGRANLAGGDGRGRGKAGARCQPAGAGPAAAGIRPYPASAFQRRARDTGH